MEPRSASGFQPIPSMPRVVAAFFAAVTPAELGVLEARPRCPAPGGREYVDRAEGQQVERLRYQALLAGRQFTRVDRT